MRLPAFPLLPTRNFAGLTFILAAMWYAAASQNNSPAYLLFFLLLGVVAVSLPHTLVNLKDLKVSTESSQPAFAGQEVSLPVEIRNLSKRARHTISVSLPQAGGSPEVVDDLPPEKAARTVVRFTAPWRGEHEITEILLASAWPLGFVKSTRLCAVSQRYLVYPRPEGDPRLPRGAARKARQSEAQHTEGEDFTGVRSYIPGESQRHIDWKAVARGQSLMTKQFASESDGALHLDFDTLQRSGVEARLSQLALWIIEAERARQRYSLRLPSVEISASIGEAHYHKCLRALALFR